MTNEISIQLEPGQPMSCLVDDNFEAESREPLKWRFDESWFYQQFIKDFFHPKIISSYGSTSWTWSANFILAIFIDIFTITFTLINIPKLLLKSRWLRPWTSDKLSPCQEITSCLVVRGSLVKSNVLIDDEDVLPMNATFEMADDDISLVSRILNLTTYMIWL